MPADTQINDTLFWALLWMLTIVIPIVICSYTFRWLYSSGYKIMAVIVPLAELAVMIAWYNSIQL